MSTARELLLIGAGGLGRETAEAVRALNRTEPRFELLGFLDDDPALAGADVDGLPVLGTVDDVTRFPEASVVVCTAGLHDPGSRRRIVGRIALPPSRYATVVHPSTPIPAGSSVGPGCIVLASVVVTAPVWVGSHVVVMPTTVLTHDNLLEDYVTLGAGVRLGGRSCVREGAYLGAGALVREDTTIGRGSVAGMGAVVTRDIPDDETHTGRPARRSSGPTRTGEPRITVHVPAYNYGRFLAEALDSLIHQSFTDWEAVVIDDASTDDTAEVLADFQDPRIRTVHHEVNRGHIPTYNEGLELAKGDLFAILSADDRYKPTFLERVVAFFDAHPAVALVTTHGDRIDEQGRVYDAEIAPFDRTGVYDGLPLLFERTFVAASAGVARTAALRALGGYDERLEHSSDAYLWRQLATSGPVGYVHERLYERRFHDRSMSRGVTQSEVLATEHADQLRWMFSRTDLPAPIRAMRRHAWSELHWKIASTRFDERHLASTLRHAAAAIRIDPAVVNRHRPVRAVRRVLARRVARRSEVRPAGGGASDPSVFVHETALCEASDVGAGTKIWGFAHVMSGARVGVDCKIGDHVFVETGATIGDRVTLKNSTMVWDAVTIEDDVFIGPGVVFTNDLVPRARQSKGRDEFLPTRVRKGASIGANATVICGTTVGPHAMVGAASVVTSDVAAHALVVGSPARRMGWACECGRRLADDLLCGCGRGYREVDDVVGLELLDA